MLRYYFLSCLLLLAITGHSQNAELPNIIFITVDDLGWADLGCYGADLHETPNIDALARTSTLFTNSYAAAPVCSPTRASIMTGKTPAKLQLTIWIEAAGHERKITSDQKFITPQTEENLSLEEVTLAELLKQKGYLTAHVGKWHLGDLMHFPETQGFDISFAASQRGAPPTFFYPYRGQAFGEFRFVTDMAMDADNHYFSEREGEYLTDRLTDEAIKIMRDARQKPFFLNLSYYSVHTPIEAKEEDVQYFQKKKKGSFSHQNETYAAMVKSIDDNVGRIISYLKSSGFFDNTLLVLLSDNGGFINEYNDIKVTNNAPLRSGKGSLYEGGIRIPTIISAPFLGEQTRSAGTPISTIDYLPTICEWLGMNLPEGVEGRSFLSALSGKEDAALNERSLFWHYPHYYHTTTPVSAIRQGDWKLIEYLENEEVELYNLADDTSEENNLSEKHSQKSSELLQLLHNWKKQVNAGKIIKNEKYENDK
jgi:arylsulfatase A-like enzyme